MISGPKQGLLFVMFQPRSQAKSIRPTFLNSLRLCWASGVALVVKASSQRSDSNDAGEEAGAPEDLKVVVSIKGGRATIGVQQPSSDPYMESFDAGDLAGLAQEVLP